MIQFKIITILIIIYIANKKLKSSLSNIYDYINGYKYFDEVLDDYARIYADRVNSNQAWTWDDAIPGGENFSKNQKSMVKQQAIYNRLIPEITITKVDGMKYGFPDFESAGIVKETVYLPEEMWKMSDAKQFKWLDEQIGGTVEGAILGIIQRSLVKCN